MGAGPALVEVAGPALDGPPPEALAALAGQHSKQNGVLIYRVLIKYCVFSKIFKYSGVLSFSLIPRCQCVYTHQAGRKPALQQNWQSSEKKIKEKHII